MLLPVPPTSNQNRSISSGTHVLRQPRKLASPPAPGRPPLYSRCPRDAATSRSSTRASGAGSRRCCWTRRGSVRAISRNSRACRSAYMGQYGSQRVRATAADRGDRGATNGHHAHRVPAVQPPEDAGQAEVADAVVLDGAAQQQGRGAVREGGRRDGRRCALRLGIVAASRQGFAFAKLVAKVPLCPLIVARTRGGDRARNTLLQAALRFLSSYKRLLSARSHMPMSHSPLRAALAPSRSISLYLSLAAPRAPRA